MDFNEDDKKISLSMKALENAEDAVSQEMYEDVAEDAAEDMVEESITE